MLLNIGVILCALGLVAWISLVSLKKEEKYEKVVQDYQNSLKLVYMEINAAKAHLEGLDEKGYMGTDDEVGYYYRAMTEIQERLDDLFNLNYGEKEEE